MIQYFLGGFVAGVSITAFIIGKELYVTYLKNVAQKNQIEQLENLNAKFEHLLTKTKS